MLFSQLLVTVVTAQNVRMAILGTAETEEWVGLTSHTKKGTTSI